MDPEAYGRPNDNAPKELSDFAFLIGKWRGEGRSRNEDGTSSPYQMTWMGRYILDGYAIADEARILDSGGGPEAIFVTYRFYDRDRKRWIIEAWNVLESMMIHETPDDPGGVRVSEDSITLLIRWPHALGRELFLNRTEDHFTYRHDVSTDDGETWIEGVDLIEADRIAE